MKLASMRPLAEQKPASLASPWPSSRKSCVSWPCRKVAASAPWARITPQSSSLARPCRVEASKSKSEVVEALMVAFVFLGPPSWRSNIIAGS